MINTWKLTLRQRIAEIFRRLILLFLEDTIATEQSRPNILPWALPFNVLRLLAFTYRADSRRYYKAITRRDISQ